MKTRAQIAVICDNGGGMTLQTYTRPRYLHYYQDAAQLATDLRSLATSHPCEWDGNECTAETWQTLRGETVRNGGYRWFAGLVADVIAQLIEDGAEGGRCESWGNVRDLAAALAAATGKA